MDLAHVPTPLLSDGYRGVCFMVICLCIWGVCMSQFTKKKDSDPRRKYSLGVELYVCGIRKLGCDLCLTHRYWGLGNTDNVYP